MNTRFSVATHILTFLQTQEGEPVSSEMLASSVNTNPSLIRRLLSQLAKAGLTKSQMGAGGGALLARDGRSISLLDVFKAVEEPGLFAVHDTSAPQCPVGRHIEGVLKGRVRAAEKAVAVEFASVSIADIADEIRKKRK
jgi:Rrf2 family protein